MTKSYVFSPKPPVALPVVGSAKYFPVRRVYCIGRNYAAHAREMGGNPDREPPFFFMKPGDAVQCVAGPKLAPHAYPPARPTTTMNSNSWQPCARVGGTSRSPTLCRMSSATRLAST